MIPIFEDFLMLLGLVHPAKVHSPRLPPAWTGFDNISCPGASAHSGADLAWFDWCMQKSNLRFAGGYLQGTNLPPNPNHLPFTAETNPAAPKFVRHWMENYGDLRAHGWGTQMFYFGYSWHVKRKMPGSVHAADYKKLGQLHGLHARMIVKDANLGMDDAVVYIDNEDGGGTNIVHGIGDYYEGFFTALADATLQDTRVNPPTDLPTLRPGIYMRGAEASHVLSKWPSVFIWQDDPFTKAHFTREYVSAGANQTLTQTLSPLPTRKNALVQLGTVRPVSRSLGRQFVQGLGDKIPSSTVTGIHHQPTGNFDYDNSAVRDPSYPAGDPRIAVAAGSGAVVVARGAFSASPTQAQTAVQLLLAGAWTNVALPAFHWVEPDAPLAAAFYPTATPQRLATFLDDGTVAVCQPDQPAPAWTALFGPTSPAPRRLRALVYAMFEPAPTSDEQIYWIGSDRSIHGVRNAGSGWSGPATVGGILTVAPAAGLAVACLQDIAVLLFTVESSGLLTAICWTAATDSWPPSNVLPLETAAPSAFLPMTALAAVSPGNKKLFVFGIATDLTLKYVEYTAGATKPWSKPQRLGAAGDYVFVHSRIATLVVSATQVQVAVFTDTGDVRLHTLDGSSGAWKEPSAAQVLKQPDPNAPSKTYARPAAAAISEPAYGWRLNPFGDLALAYEPAPVPEVGTFTAVYAAGLSKPNAAAKLPPPPGTGFQRFTTLLRQSLDPINPGWQLYR